MELNSEVDLPLLTRTLHLSGCHFGTKPAGWSYPRHHHYLFELLHCSQGEVVQEIGDESFPLRAGQWLLIRSGIPHATANEASEDYSYFNLHFDFDDSVLREGLCRKPYILLDTEEVDSLGLNTLASAIKKAMAHASASTINADALGASINRLRIQSHALELVARIAELSVVASAADRRLEPESAAGVTVASATLAHAVEAYLREGLRDGLTTKEIAAMLNVSPSRCAQSFAATYGQSIRQYRSRLILNEAKRLLLCTPKPIGEIAEELRFESASHFSRQFKRWTGMSPSVYRPVHLR